MSVSDGFNSTLVGLQQLSTGSFMNQTLGPAYAQRAKSCSLPRLCPGWLLTLLLADGRPSIDVSSVVAASAGSNWEARLWQTCRSICSFSQMLTQSKTFSVDLQGCHSNAYCEVRRFLAVSSMPITVRLLFFALLTLNNTIPAVGSGDFVPSFSTAPPPVTLCQSVIERDISSAF